MHAPPDGSSHGTRAIEVGEDFNKLRERKSPVFAFPLGVGYQVFGQCRVCWFGTLESFRVNRSVLCYSSWFDLAS